MASLEAKSAAGSGKKLADLRVVDLRLQLEKRGLEKAGVKAVLVERLTKALEDDGESVETFRFEVSEVSSPAAKKTPRKIEATASSTDVKEKVQENGEDKKDDSTDKPEDTEDEKMETETTPVKASEPVTDKSSGNAAKTPQVKVDKTAANDSTLAPPDPLDVSVKNPLTIEDAIKMDTSQEPRNDDSVSLVVHVDDQNDLDYDIYGTPAKKAKTGPDGDKSDEKTDVRATGEKTTVAAEATGKSANGEKDDGSKSDAAVKTTDVEKTEEKSAENGTKTSTGDAAKTAKDGKGKPKTSGKNLWVRGLAATTRATDLKSLFTKHGKVAGAKVVTNAKSPGSRCFGLVMMSSAEEATKCIENLNHTELHGRSITVERAKTDPVSNVKKPVAKTPQPKRPERTHERSKSDTIKKRAPPSVEKRKDDTSSKKVDPKSKDAKKSTSPKKASPSKPKPTTVKKTPEKPKEEPVKEEKKEESKTTKEEVKIETAAMDVTATPESTSGEQNDKVKSETKPDIAEKKDEKTEAEKTETTATVTKTPDKTSVKTDEKSPPKKSPSSVKSKKDDPKSSSSTRSKSGDRRSTGSHHSSDKRDAEKERREREKIYRRERAIREAERKRRMIAEKELRRQRAIERQQKDEAVRLARERERLRIEREELERAKIEAEQLERERIRLERERRERERLLEREKEEQRKLEQQRLEREREREREKERERERQRERERKERERVDLERCAPKRSYDSRTTTTKDDPFWDNKRAATSATTTTNTRQTERISPSLRPGFQTDRERCKERFMEFERGSSKKDARDHSRSSAATTTTTTDPHDRRVERYDRRSNPSESRREDSREVVVQRGSGSRSGDDRHYTSNTNTRYEKRQSPPRKRDDRVSHTTRAATRRDPSPPRRSTDSRAEWKSERSNLTQNQDRRYQSDQHSRQYNQPQGGGRDQWSANKPYSQGPVGHGNVIQGAHWNTASNKDAHPHNQWGSQNMPGQQMPRHQSDRWPNMNPPQQQRQQQPHQSGLHAAPRYNAAYHSAAQYINSGLTTKVWIIGDSIVYWAMMEAGQRPEGLSLGLKDMELEWLGHPDLRFRDTPSYLESRLKICSPPDVLVIHAGIIDVTESSLGDVVSLLRQGLQAIKDLVPHARIIWSDVIPRHYYFGAESQKGKDMTRKRMNKEARTILRLLCGQVLKHTSFTWDKITFFQDDSKDLSAAGKDVFLNDLRLGIKFLIDHPMTPAYPVEEVPF
ncbi:uncharacterized protein LOC141903815 isoform X1 [Tubulanus polymorphus]|uniref:uncharacterized protein LOC141903815 isoform X1 n=1 Tax=Tubulanus polymorphus TaxID=672921 RepID=UPI003DA5BA3B